MVLYFLLSFAVAWVFWLSAATISTLPSAEALRALLFLPGTFAPAIIAIALTAMREGRGGVQSLLSRILKWKVPGRYYAFAVGYMIVIRLGAALVHRVLMGTWPPMWQEPPYLMLGAIVLSTPFQAGEEIGWRGYALPRLADRFGLAAASVILGLIWAVWHLPLFFVGGPGPGDSFPVFILAATALSVAMAWLYWKTAGSLLLVMLMHATSNNTRGILAPSVEPFGFLGLRTSLIGWLVVTLLWVTAAFFLVQMRNRRLGERGALRHEHAAG
jgi:uncharacterized protein